MICRILTLTSLVATGLLGELTTDQKVSDFNYLVGLYAKHYMPYEWKRDVLGVDLYKVQPWLDQVKQSKSDLEYYDICVRYVAALQDSHDEYTLPSDYTAYLNFDVDIFDGAVLINAISRSILPAARYSFAIGDEVISVDGVAVNDLIERFIPYSANGSANASSRRRLAADKITYRTQGAFPMAAQHGPTASVVVKRQVGDTQTYEIPWTASGTPIVASGPVLSPMLKKSAQPLSRARSAASHTGKGDAWGVYSGPEQSPDPSSDPYADAQIMRGLDSQLAFGGFGNRASVFNPPAGIKLRLGLLAADYFVSGTFPSGGKTFGFIRIYTMSPNSYSAALQQFQTEIAYMEQNTDGMLIDVMANSGGDLCYTETLEQSLIPHPFRSFAYEVRATDFWVQVYSQKLTAAIRSGLDPAIVDAYRGYLNQVSSANSQTRGDTEYVPVCGPYFENVAPTMDKSGSILAYTKPLVVITDEFTLSAGESFAMILQDEKRATVFGLRTDGGGGNPASYGAGAYSEGSTRVTRSLVTRKSNVQTPGFPASHYLENTGVYPDVLMDYMTKDNLASGGVAFLNAAINTLAALVP